MWRQTEFKAERKNWIVGKQESQRREYREKKYAKKKPTTKKKVSKVQRDGEWERKEKEKYYSFIYDPPAKYSWLILARLKSF